MIYHTGSKFLEPQSGVTVRFSGPFIVTVGLSHYETVWKIYIRRQCANQYRSNRVQLNSGSTVKKLIRIISFQSEHWHLFLKLNKFDELVFFTVPTNPTESEMSIMVMSKVIDKLTTSPTSEERGEGSHSVDL